MLATLQRQFWMSTAQVAAAAGMDKVRCSAVLRRLWLEGDAQRQPMAGSGWVYRRSRT